MDRQSRDRPTIVQWLIIAVMLAFVVLLGACAIVTEPPGYEACGPNPVTEPSDLRREAHGCKRQ
jgi:hypothetical protein